MKPTTGEVSVRVYRESVINLNFSCPYSEPTEKWNKRSGQVENQNITFITDNVNVKNVAKNYKQVNFQMLCSI